MEWSSIFVNIAIIYLMIGLGISFRIWYDDYRKIQKIVFVKPCIGEIILQLFIGISIVICWLPIILEEYLDLIE